MNNPLLGNAPVFSVLSEADQERISECLHLERFHAGDVLFRIGDESCALYLVKTGWVRLSASGGFTLASQGPGSLVGEADLFLEHPRSVGAVIASEAELWVLARDDLLDVIGHSPEIGIELSAAFGARLPLLDRYLIERRLKPLSFLSGLKEETLAAVARRLVPIQKKAGEFLVEADQAPEALFIVESGRVQLHGSEEGGDFSELGPGESFGEMALLTGKSHAHSAQTATDAVLWALPAAEFESAAEEHPDLRLALSKSVREPLTSSDKSRAGMRLSKIPLFCGLSDDVLAAVAERMLLCHVPAGELIFAEGSAGDALYVVDSGQVELLPSVRQSGTALARLGPDAYFGEMALLTGKPHPSSARAVTHCNLWMLYRSDFDSLVNRYPAISLALSRVLSERLAEMDRHFAESHLRGVKMLAGLSSSQLEAISARLTPARFHQGEVILHEGDPGDAMYFVESGRVRIDQGAGGKLRTLAELGAGDLFGETALLTRSPHSATASALSEVNLWALAQADFDELVGIYPSLALALSRLLSERLRDADERILREPAPAQTAVAAAPLPEPIRRASVPQAGSVRLGDAAQPRREIRRPVIQPKPKAKVAGPGLGVRLRQGFGQTAGWFAGLSTGAKVRLVVVTLLLVWLVGVAVPALLIAALRTANATSGTETVVLARAESSTLAAESRLAAAPIMAAEEPLLGDEPPLQGALPPQAVAAVEKVVASVPVLEATSAPTLPPAPTATPWVIVITNTPVPVTDTPVPTETPIPPSATPKPTSRTVSAPPPATKAPVPQQPAAQAAPLPLSILDQAGNSHDWGWLTGYFGAVSLNRGSGAARVQTLQERVGPAELAVHVERNGVPVVGYPVMFFYPDAPLLQASLQACGLDRAMVIYTKENGNAEFAMGGGSYLSPPGGGPHVVWVGGAGSDCLGGLGMLHGTEHTHIDSRWAVP